MENKRRNHAAMDTGLGNLELRNQEVDKVLRKEEERRAKKERKKQELQESFSYKLMYGVKRVMDDFCLDPILGFIPGGVGDMITSISMFPAIYVALFKIRSIPLTLAVIFNCLCDVMVGLIPFWIGNILDFFYRANRKNYRLIVGFVEDDEEVISEVNRKAVVTAILIFLFGVLIYFMLKLVAWMIGGAVDMLSGAWDWLVGLF